MVSERNGLNVEIKNAGSLSISKSKIRPLYYYGPRWESIQVARMRINCSSLCAHLCFHLHVIDNPACVCGEENEDPTHFFFHGQQYVEQRRETLHNMSVSETTVHDIIFGHDTLLIEENKLNMDDVIQFVRNLIYYKHSHNVQPHPDHHTASSYNIIVNYI